MDSLFFCSPIGLGHATRDAAVAKNFDHVVTFVTGSSAADFLKKSEFNVKDRYSPPKFMVKNGLLQKSLKWLWQYYQYYKDCKKIASEIIKQESPKIVISDEDFASLTVAQEQCIPNVLITDILETKFTSGIGSFIEKKMNKSMKEIISKCDVVILPEEGNDEGNIKRTGPIVRQTNFSREELRKQFSFDKKTIVISVGGTNAGYFLIEKALESIKKIKDDYDAVIISGPSINEKYENAKNLGFVTNLHELIYASDLIISLAGKSTIDEANAYGTPGIFIPIKNHFEQEDNAKEQGYSYEDVFRLDDLIQERIEQTRNEKRTDGAKKAVDIIKKLSDV